MKRKLVSVSPWILAAACGLLAVIIAVFAVNNYNREKRLMMDALLQKGLAVIRFLDTGVRVSMRASWQGREDNGYSWVDHVQRVIDQLHDQSDIHFVELIDNHGTVLAATNAERVGARLDSATLVFSFNQVEGEPVFRIYRQEGNNHRGFQVAKLYSPRFRGPMAHSSQHGRFMMDRMSRGQQGFERLPRELEQLRGKEYALLVEVDLQQFDNAVKRQLLQIVILSVVLLLVGIGGWLSLLTLQGLRGSQSRLSRVSAFNDMLVGALPVGLIGTDAEGRIQIVNEAAAKICGVSEKALLDRLPEQVLPLQLARHFSRRGAAGSDAQSEEIILSSGGEEQALLLTFLSIADREGRFTGEVLLMQDLSDLRYLEHELRRSERLAALGKMAAGVAHELRNPLSSIKGLAMLLKTKVHQDQEGEKTADVMVQEVERLNRSIGELLDYARPEKLQLVPTSLSAVLEKAVTLVSVDAEALGISLLTELQSGDDLVMLDEDRMNQVFLNLLLNAIQAMPEGGRLNISTSVEGGAVYCRFKDTGVGIAKDDLGHVFDPYFTTKNDGTGLGLALSAKIVEEHGGEISLRSEPALGTEVTVKLPLAA